MTALAIAGLALLAGAAYRLRRAGSMSRGRGSEVISGSGNVRVTLIRAP